MLDLTALKYTFDQFNDIIWGFLVEIDTDYKELQDVPVSDTLNAAHV